ncbi:MAG: NYN domain-containing protein, partial [Gemmataceae bacterium]
MMKSNRTPDQDHTLAVFIDFENLAMGFNGRRDRFNVERILERLVEKGKIVVKRAYCDWSRFGHYTGPLHESAIELIEIPKRATSGKNSADIRLVVDAMDLAYSKDHIDTFVIVSGDSDFSPLVSKLKELGKHVIGLGLVEATSNLLRDNCDEFIYYEDLDRPTPNLNAIDGTMPEAKRKMFALMMDSLIALRRESKDVIYSSMVKDTMKRKKPSFNEEYHGYRTFSELLEDAQSQGLVELEKSKSSGTYVITRFGTEPKVNFSPGNGAPANGNGNGNGFGHGNGHGPNLGQNHGPQQHLPGPREPRRNLTPLPPHQQLPPQAPVMNAPVPVPMPPRERLPERERPPERPPERERLPERERPPERPPELRRQPLPPVPMAAPPRLPEPIQSVPLLGRALLDEIEPIDEIPSYRPGSSVKIVEPLPASKPPAGGKPAQVKKASTVKKEPKEPKEA